MSQLPTGWTATQLNNILSQIIGGGTPSKAHSDFFNGSIPFMTVKDLYGRFPSDTIDHISEAAVASSATSLVPADTLIVATRMSLGKIVRPTVSVAINQDLKALLLADEIHKTYVEHFWRSSATHIQSLGTGTTVQGIRLEDIRELEIPLAPLPEQKRIADKLDSVLARVDACRDRLDRLPALLKRFRQSILAAATSGQLTEDWRTETQQFGAATNDDLPPGWKWSSPENIKSKDKYALAIGPFGSNLKVPDYRPEGIPLVFVREIRARQFGGSATKYVTEEKAKELSAHSISGGDLLITKMGDPPGDTAIYPSNASPAVITADCIKFKVDEQVASCMFIQVVMESPQTKIRLQEITAGVAQQKISLQRFKGFPLPLAPIPEQTEIVRRVEILFAFADRLETHLATARRQVGQLTPALLAKAFRGELVAQDPADEPAAELLKRLAAQREAAPKTKRSRKIANP